MPVICRIATTIMMFAESGRTTWTKRAEEAPAVHAGGLDQVRRGCEEKKFLKIIVTMGTARIV